MPAYVSTLIFLMAIGTVVLDAAIVIGVLMLFGRSSRAWLRNALGGNALVFIIVLTVASVAGTLLIEFAGGLVPCDLCWWERIFMYPIAFISVIAFLKNAKFSDISEYVLTFSSIGALIALYHQLLQILPSGALIPCDPTNDCAIRTIFYFDFVTIPWMAFTVFAAIFFIALFGCKYRKN